MAQTVAPKRLLSVDTLRGFDMLLIAGGGTFIERLKGKTGLSWVDAIADQLTHPAWHGFTFYDFIFPLFLFIAGVSMVFSLESGLEKGLSRETLVKKVFKRMIILFLLGIIDKNIPTDVFNPSNIRFGTVLSRIGIASFFGALFYLYLSPRQRLAGVVSILVGYYAMIFMIPVPGFGAGDISFEGNLVGWFDRTFMPGKLLQKTYDENALLTQLPAMCLTILGTFAGLKLREVSSSGQAKVIWLVACGAVSIAIGLLWSLHFPLNKHLWSSSFILVTAGMAFLFMAAFYYVIDVLQFRRWTFFFEVIGLNSIAIYLACRFVNFEDIARKLFGGLYSFTDETWHPVFSALGGLALTWWLMYFLYKKKIFFKI
jgi:predicted acyltransferase